MSAGTSREASPSPEEKSPKKLPTLEDFGVERKEEILSNGARIIVFERPHTPVHLRASFLAGSRYDLLGKEGTAHFMEHMITAGSRNFPTKDKLAAYIEGLGGGISAHTGPEILTVDVATADPSDLKEAVKVMQEVLLFPRFDPQTLENERKSVLRELAKRRAHPAGMLSETGRMLFFQGTDLGRRESEESLQKITREDLLNHYSSLTSGQMVLVASGGIDAGELKGMAEEELLLPKSPPLEKSPPLPIRKEKGIAITRYPGLKEVHLALGIRTVEAFHPDGYPLEIIGEVLGGGRASRLIRKLRYEKGLVYSAGISGAAISDTGIERIGGATSKEDLNEVLGIITSELAKVKEEGLTQEEIQFAKDKIVKSKRGEMQTSQSWVGFHSYGELLGVGKEETLTEYLRKIDAVTSEDIQRVAQTYFVPERMYLALVGDLEEKDVKVNF